VPHTEVAHLREQFIAHRPRLRDAAARILGCRQRAEDVVQDAFVKINEIAPGFDVQQPVAYLFRVVRNLAIDRHRRAAFESTVFAAEEDGLNVMGENDGPEAIMIGRQYLRLVSQALAELPARTRHVFELYRIGEYTQRQIADQLDISTTLVNFMIRDAMNHCRSAIANGL
jgi:RNA polymerase sigma factor (sigma-70 family)